MMCSPASCKPPSRTPNETQKIEGNLESWLLGFNDFQTRDSDFDGNIQSSLARMLKSCFLGRALGNMVATKFFSVILRFILLLRFILPTRIVFCHLSSLLLVGCVCPVCPNCLCLSTRPGPWHEMIRAFHLRFSCC